MTDKELLNETVLKIIAKLENHIGTGAIEIRKVCPPEILAKALYCLYKTHGQIADLYADAVHLPVEARRSLNTTVEDLTRTSAAVFAQTADKLAGLGGDAPSANLEDEAEDEAESEELPTRVYFAPTDEDGEEIKH